MTDLVAVKPFRYATRALRPGDDFVAKSRQDARVLVAIGKARRAAVPIEAPVTGDPAPDRGNLDALRAKYQAIFGKRPFMGWDADAIQEKIAGAETPGDAD